MNVYDAIVSRRTIRKFKQTPIAEDVLRKLVNAARLAPQASNLQPMKYVVVDDQELLDSVFATTKWAAYIAPEGTPKPGERPAAYVVILADLEIRGSGYDTDAGAAVENLILAGVGEGIGSCWIGSVDRDRLRELLGIPERYAIHSIVALGYPAESPVAVEAEDCIKYYKDETGTLHVPKRRLEEVMFRNRIQDLV
ncbi:MAG: nitroreductase family protein [Limnochordia bacterium]|jgi:nitroreductase